GHEWLRPGRKGLLPTARSQGGGCPLQGRKGHPRGKGYRLQGRTLAATTSSRGGCPCQQHEAPPPTQGSDDGGDADGSKERARASF
ncbi:hypothetical protein B296_00044692, partial [Ensete ventricosum]